MFLSQINICEYQVVSFVFKILAIKLIALVFQCHSIQKRMVVISYKKQN